jgi:hypothetical protein
MHTLVCCAYFTYPHLASAAKLRRKGRNGITNLRVSKCGWHERKRSVHGEGLGSEVARAMGSYRFIGVSVVARGVTGAASHAKRRHVATMIAATHLALPSIFFFRFVLS